MSHCWVELASLNRSLWRARASGDIPLSRIASANLASPYDLEPDINDAICACAVRSSLDLSHVRSTDATDCVFPLPAIAMASSAASSSARLAP